MNNLAIERIKKCSPQPLSVSNELVIFSHIPKTAGSALNRNIRRNCKDVFFLHVWDHDRDTNLSDWVADLNQKSSTVNSNPSGVARTVLGHVGFGIHEFMNYSSCTYITLLREPVARVISHYHQLRQFGAEASSSTQAARNLNLEEFVRQDKSTIADNLQTRFLSGLGWHIACNSKGWQQILKESNQDITKFQIRAGECNDEMLEIAKDNLSKYFVFGLQDRFSESLNLFQKCLNWKKISDSKVHVRTKVAHEDVSPTTIQLIQERNQLDIELYQFAQSLFDSQWGKLL